MKSSNIDNWELWYAFFRCCIELSEERSAQAANLITGENRVASEADIVEKFKPVLHEVHEAIGCDKCKAEQPQITRN